MKSVTSKSPTRDIILRSIKALSPATVEQLAEAATVSPVTVRHHLNSLQADGLIEVEAVRRKVGRPYYVYHLSEAGLELFPKKYYSLSSRLLEEMKERFPAEVVADLFQGVVRRIIEEHSGEFEQLPFETRLDYLVDLLAQEGFLARWERSENVYRIVEYSCPYLSMGQLHAEICTLDTTLIEAVMRTEVQQHSCMLKGDSSCQFTFGRAGDDSADTSAPTILLSEVRIP